VSRLLVAQRALTVPGWAKDALWRRAQAIPSLDLRFADNKSLVDAVTGANLVTFTRASSGTFVGSDGVLQTAATDAPRFDHNPTTGESLGLLVEESRTNLLLQSEDLATTWTPGTGNVITANTWTAPDGTLTGDQFTVGTASTAPAQSVTVAASSSYTLSFYLNTLLTSSAFLRLRFSTSAGSISAFFNVSTLAFETLNGITNPTVQRVGTNIYKLSVTYTYDAVSAGSRSVAIASVTTDNGGTADTGKIVAIWGMQYELGAFPTSYIPTTTATVTRSADVASITGSAFSSWYNQTAGSMFTEAQGTSFVTGAVRRYFEISDGTANNRILLGYSATNAVRGIANTGGVSQTNISATATPANMSKFAFAFAADNAQIAANGLLGTEDTSVTLPTVSTLYIGGEPTLAATTTLNGHIRRLTYWPTRLPNSTIQAVTQ